MAGQMPDIPTLADTPPPLTAPSPRSAAVAPAPARRPSPSVRRTGLSLDPAALNPSYRFETADRVHGRHSAPPCHSREMRRPAAPAPWHGYAAAGWPRHTRRRRRGTPRTITRADDSNLPHSGL